jgi:N-methylhydantoinase B
MLAAARTAERRLHEICERFGVERVITFVDAWLDYSEARARAAIRRLPEGVISASTRPDP